MPIIVSLQEMFALADEEVTLEDSLQKLAIAEAE